MERASRTRQATGLLLGVLLLAWIAYRLIAAGKAPPPSPETIGHEASRTSSIAAAATARDHPNFAVSGAIRRLGSKAFSLEGSTVPPEGKAMDVIRALERQTEDGGGHAALMIALKLMSCRHAIEHQDDDELLFIEAQVFGGVDEAVRKREAQLALCEGIGADEVAKIGQWLQRAADSGNVNAQIYYASSASTILGSQAEMLRSPERVVEFKTRAIHYLQSAASHGSVDALYHLGSAYRNGLLADRDDVRAYGYFLASAKANSHIKPWDMGQLEASMPVQERRRAAQMAKEIYRDCCEIN